MEPLEVRSFSTGGSRACQTSTFINRKLLLGLFKGAIPDLLSTVLKRSFGGSGLYLK